jgi:hypothetical protein
LKKFARYRAGVLQVAQRRYFSAAAGFTANGRVSIGWGGAVRFAGPGHARWIRKL